MARRLTFGTALDDGDVLVLQGVEYQMQPVGMRAMRDLIRKNADPTATDGDRIEAAIDLVCAAVVPGEREKLKEQIEERVPPGIVTQMARAISDGVADLDPMRQVSSSDGSPEPGPPSTDGALLTTSIPSTSPSAESSTSTSTPSESGPTPEP